LSAAQKPLAGADLCVHCGFCLQACPTYLTLDDENDSPRGRIVLMKGLVGGVLDMRDEAVTQHLDQCLGCRACETACPSGVPYGQLLEESRAAIAEVAPLNFTTRAILFVFARPGLSAVAMAFARAARFLGISRLLARLPGRVGIAMATVEATRRGPEPVYRIDATPRGETAAVLTGCVMEGLLAPVNRATERVLKRNGYELREAPDQRCCGALHAHAGDRTAARELARTNIAAFEQSGADFIAVNSAGCGAAMKEYAHLLSDDPAWHSRAAGFSAKVRDVSELLAAAGPATAKSGEMHVAVDHPCHLQHAQRLSAQPAAVMSALSGASCAELPDASSCCGAAGLYSLANPALSQQILAPKLANILGGGASCVATGNPGCMMHIGGGLVRSGSSIPVRHPVELLDAAYANEARSA
jgi:glycolate oxidase iron-sulfur subunit